MKKYQDIFYGTDLMDATLNRDHFMVVVGALAVVGFIYLTPPIIKLVLGERKYHAICDIIFGPSDFTLLNLYLMDTKKELCIIISNAERVMQHLTDNILNIESRLSNIENSVISQESFERIREELISIRSDIANISNEMAQNITGTTLTNAEWQETMPTQNINVDTHNEQGERLNLGLLDGPYTVGELEVARTATMAVENLGGLAINGAVESSINNIYKVLISFVPAPTTILMTVTSIALKAIVIYKSNPEVYQFMYELYKPRKISFMTKFIQIWRVIKS